MSWQGRPTLNVCAAQMEGDPTGKLRFLLLAFMSYWQIHLFCCSCCHRCCHLLTSEPSFYNLPTGTDDQWLSRDLLDLQGHVGAAGVIMSSHSFHGKTVNVRLPRLHCITPPNRSLLINPQSINSAALENTGQSNYGRKQNMEKG